MSLKCVCSSANHSVSMGSIPRTTCIVFKLRRARAPAPIMCTFYRGTIESILTSCITVLYGTCNASCRKTLQLRRLLVSLSPPSRTFITPVLSAKPSALQVIPPTRHTASSVCYHQEGGDCRGQVISLVCTLSAMCLVPLYIFFYNVRICIVCIIYIYIYIYIYIICIFMFYC